MKVIRFVFLLTLAMATTVGKAQSLSVYISDDNGAFTNVRNAPKGKVVAKIPTSKIVMLDVTSPQNGWWQIDGGKVYYTGDDDETVTLKGSSTGYWIHHSVIGLGSRNYGGETLRLRKSPDKKSAVVFSFKEELHLMPLEVRGDWVKVKTGDGKHTGWIESEWLCDNPLTNCC